MAGGGVPLALTVRAATQWLSGVYCDGATLIAQVIPSTERAAAVFDDRRCSTSFALPAARLQPHFQRPLPAASAIFALIICAPKRSGGVWKSGASESCSNVSRPDAQGQTVRVCRDQGGSARAEMASRRRGIWVLHDIGERVDCVHGSRAASGRARIAFSLVMASCCCSASWLNAIHLATFHCLRLFGCRFVCFEWRIQSSAHAFNASTPNEIEPDIGLPANGDPISVGNPGSSTSLNGQRAESRTSRGLREYGVGRRPGIGYYRVASSSA